MGDKNNLVSVRRSDFEVFQALAKDSEENVSTAQKEYSQDIPLDKPWGSGPPVLPPHLLQVILNKDTPLSVSALALDSLIRSQSNTSFRDLPVWTDIAARTESRHVESFVRTIDQGRCHGAECHTSFPQEIRHNVTVQTHLDDHGT